MDTEADILSGVEPIAYPVDSDEPMSLEDAVRDLGEAREKALNPKPAESAQAATADEASPPEDDAGPEEVPGETQEENPEENLPPVEPPRSWTKEAKDRWNTIPREAQEEFARIEQGREREFLRAQQETAEKAKAMEAKVKEAEQARQQYESKLSTTVKVMQDALQAEFGDIQSLADVRKLQAEDPFRFQAWQVRQMELTAAQAEKLAADQRQAQEKQTKRSAYEDEQNKLLMTLVPEMAEPKKASELRDRAVRMLTDDLGLTNDQLSRWMQDDVGHEILSNAAIQKIIADGLKLKDIQSAPKAVVKPNLPPVQRPGTAKPATAGITASIQTLEKQLANATGDRAVEISTQIYQLEQKAAARQKG